ncbi:MAG: outer membrane lipoprotein-sorting protein [Chitinispirillaceae bacterium]|nr:outer membrane lipoprotein-sorting protein [Chitinispirillaceae bacterium]
MMKMKFLYLVLLATTGIAAIDGNEILKKMDLNRTWKSIVSTAKMEIIVDDEVRVKTMEISGLSEGNRSLVLFTNAEDEGTKYLMLGDDLWIYFPEENDVVKISGHMLKEGMMGSDVSYEDALEADKLSDKYDVAITGEEAYNGNDCHLLTLTAKGKDAPYFKRVMWVEKRRFIAWKEELFAKSGRKLKVAKVLEVKEIGKMWYPVKVEMINTLRKNSRTVFTTESISLDAPLDESMFTMRNLRR